MVKFLKFEEYKRMKREAKKAVNKTQGEALDSLFQDQGHEKRERNV